MHPADKQDWNDFHKDGVNWQGRLTRASVVDKAHQALGDLG